ncbi:uncharacterized protein RAG0_13991 [Rhynchosporium agropyri]|uniref:MYND-type domain-containing protein n=1 Tax=Rhynchosporium agropyri TaxID=914238 RepID=A0A1E1LFE4_9HELO|nr:uncharacterized protein RAG0_13991 [Rhynchosporium agropyri]
MPRPTAINLVTFFYPIGNTPCVCLTQDLPPEDDARILLLGCGDIRNILFTAYADAAPLTRSMDITSCDHEDAIIARNVLALTLMLDDVSDQQHSSIWQIYYHFYLDDKSLKLLQVQAKKLSHLAGTIESWKAGAYGKLMAFCDEDTRRMVKQHWDEYAVSDLSKNEQVKHDNRLKASFEAAQKMKRDRVGSSFPLTGLRSTAPVSLHATTDTGKIYAHYWKHGSTDRNPTLLPKNRRLNPTFAPMETETFTLHYGTDPQLGFPLATAYIPFTKESPLLMEGGTKSDFHRITDAARTHFQAWAKSFRKSAEKFTLRFFVGDAIGFCHTLQHINSSGNVNSNWYRTKYTIQTINLYPEDYNSSGSAHSVFNVIDTSNLLDHLGSLNVLVAAAPLLERGVASILYTESLVARETNRKDYMDKLLCGSFPTMALLLGLVPIEYWTGATAVSNAAESMLDISTSVAGVPEGVNQGQMYCRIVWKPVLACGDPSDIMERKLHFDAKDLANLIHHTYRAMFEHEDHMKTLASLSMRTIRVNSCPYYNRGSLAAFLRFIKPRVVTDWDSMMELVLDRIAGDGSIMMGLSYYNDLCAHVSLMQVHDIPGLSVGCQPSDAAKFKNGLGAWKSLPTVVCMTLVVPRAKIEFIRKLTPNQLGSPNVLCTIQAASASQFSIGGWQEIFADVHLTFGELTTEAEATDDEHKVLIKEDPLGWKGKCPLLVTFNVPSWVVLRDPSKTVVTFGVQSTPQSVGTFMKSLGLTLTIDTTKLQDNNTVHITKFPPHCAGFASISTFSPMFKDEETKNGFKITISANIEQSTRSICGFTGRLDLHSENLTATLKAGFKVVLTQLSPTTIAVTLENHLLPLKLTFPVPVQSSKSRTRIARKPSYIEVIVPFADHVSNQGFTNFMFPLLLRNHVPMISNMPYLNLGCLPIIDTTSKTSTKSLEWLTSLISHQFSARELLQRDTESIEAGPRTNFKDSIFSIFMHYTGIQGAKCSVFGLNDAEHGGVQIIILVSRMLLDMASHTVVLDCAVLPLTHEMMGELVPFLGSLGNGGMVMIKVKQEEMKIWREVLPAMVERCRVWKHIPSCAYKTSGKIPLSAQNGVALICSCGAGKYPDNFSIAGVAKSNWAMARKFATRAALSPIFAVNYVERPFQLRDLLEKDEMKILVCRKCGKDHGGGGKALSKCARCLVVWYCSPECQRADWKEHKKTCKASEA